MSPLDPNIAHVLGITSPEIVTYSISTLGGGCSSASAAKLTVTGSSTDKNSMRTYFLKTARGKDAEIMFRGEHASLSAIHSVVPNLCPNSFGWGQFANGQEHFLVVQYLDLGRRSSFGGKADSLAKKLAKLHTTPAPIPDGYDTPVFGFPVETCCGDTVQDNTFSSSWAEFFAKRRLEFILVECRRKNGSDKDMEKLLGRIIDEVVPHLLGDERLNEGKGVTPVVVHGDLWSGNKGWALTIGDDEGGEMIFDPSACYAHSEYELGIMKMFGGFGSQFLKEYHSVCPKTKPIEEYEDRVALYELYHHLNHNALFGGGYRSGVMSIMSALLRKYGKVSERT